MVILQLYCSLVCPKMYYMYGFATKSRLLIVDPVHNTGMHLATGTFLRVCILNLENLPFHCEGISSSVVMLQSWRPNIITHHMVFYFIPPMEMGMNQLTTTTNLM